MTDVEAPVGVNRVMELIEQLWNNEVNEIRLCRLFSVLYEVQLSSQEDEPGALAQDIMLLAKARQSSKQFLKKHGDAVLEQLQAKLESTDDGVLEGVAQLFEERESLVTDESPEDHEEDMQRISDVFHQMDTDHNGEISRNELAWLLNVLYRGEEDESLAAAADAKAAEMTVNGMLSESLMSDFLFALLHGSESSKEAFAIIEEKVQKRAETLVKTPGFVGQIESVIAAMDFDNSGWVEEWELYEVMKIVYIPADCKPTDRSFYKAEALRRSRELSVNGSVSCDTLRQLLWDCVQSDDPAQKAKFYKIYESVDKISAAKYQYAAGAARGEDRVSQLLKMWDLNCDGFLSKEEISMAFALVALQPGMTKEEKGALLKYMEAKTTEMTKDGGVSLESMRYLLLALSHGDAVERTKFQAMWTAAANAVPTAPPVAKTVAEAATENVEASEEDLKPSTLFRQPSAPDADLSDMQGGMDEAILSAKSAMALGGMGQDGLMHLQMDSVQFDAKAAYAARLRQMEDEEQQSLADSTETNVLSKQRIPYYSSREVELHNTHDDCWVSFFGQVYNLTALIAANQGVLAEPILAFAGQDISHWFDAKTRQPRMHIDPHTCLVMPYTPYGRYIHIPPAVPDCDWDTDFETAWWCDPQYVVGKLSAKIRVLRIINTLTQHDDTLEVCSEEILSEIRNRYLRFNRHAHSYTWKCLGRPLNMNKTLEENGMVDKSEELADLLVGQAIYIPAIHLHFNDDLTVM